MSYIYDFFGTIFKFFYDLTGSYAGAILLFTVAVKLLTLPLAIKQQKNTLKQVRLRPEEMLIRARYSHDPKLLNEKLQAFYQRNNFNPMGGCLPLLIQFPVIIILYNVIQHPLQYVSKISKDTITAIATALEVTGIENSDIPLAKVINEMGGYTYGEVTVSTMNFDLFGFIDLSSQPTLAFNALLLIPILSAATAFLTTFVSRMSTKYTAANADAQKNPTMKMMTFSGPIISLIISFSLPAGVGFYWVVSNLINALQSFLLNIFMSPKKEIEKAEAELQARVEKRRAKKAVQSAERSERIEREALERKNAARKAAGLKPLLSLDSKEVDTSYGEEETTQESKEDETEND